MKFPITVTYRNLEAKIYRNQIRGVKYYKAAYRSKGGRVLLVISGEIVKQQRQLMSWTDSLIGVVQSAPIKESDFHASSRCWQIQIHP